MLAFFFYVSSPFLIAFFCDDPQVHYCVGVLAPPSLLYFREIMTAAAKKLPVSTSLRW